LKKQVDKEEKEEEWRKEQGEKPEQQHHVAEEVPSASQALPLKPQIG